MYKVGFYVPETHLEVVKSALFTAGAGKIGHYDCCAWQVKGQGQFRALKGSHPFLGSINKLEKVDEYRVELICSDDKIQEAIQALRQSHPYEEPAYEVIKVLDF